MSRLIIFFGFLIFTAYSFGQNKIALLTISNEYEDQHERSLNGEPSRQASALCKAFDDFGFKVLPSIQNFNSKDELYRELELRSKEISEVDLLFVHYGGHGVYSESGDLIIPEDSRLNDGISVDSIGVPFDSLINKISSYMDDKTKILHFTYEASRHYSDPGREIRASTLTQQNLNFQAFQKKHLNYTIIRYGVPEGHISHNNDNYTTHWIKHLENLNPKEVISKSIREFHQVRGRSNYYSEFYGRYGKKLPESRIYSLEDVTMDILISEQLKLVEP